MGYNVIADFRGGLDTRKFKLNLPPGTLTKAINGHVTQGAELEKRKAFIPYAAPRLTYGEQDTGAGITIFGSRVISWSLTSIQRITNQVFATLVPGIDGDAPLPGDVIVISGVDDASFNGTFTMTGGSAGVMQWAQAGADTASANGTASCYLAPPIQYQRLLHPDGVTQMTGVISSCEFGDGIFVVARFADNNLFYFYNGTLITDFYAGLIWSGGKTGFELAQNLSSLINGTSDYTASAPQLPGSLSFFVTAGVPNTPAIAATNTLAGDVAQPALGATITISSITYTFVTVLAGQPAYSVLISGGTSGTMANLMAAINASGGGGYSAGTLAHPDVTCGSLNAGLRTMIITAIVAGAAGNSLACSSTGNPTINPVNPTLIGGADAIASPSAVVSLYYNFSGVVQLTAFWATDSALIVQYSVPFNTSLAQTATDLATAINAANDSGDGGPGDSYGFVATTNGGQVIITPPNGVQASDSLTINVINNFGVTVPVNPFTFDVFSTPSLSDGTPYAIDETVTSLYGTVTDVLDNAGLAVVAAVAAIGQFIINAGSSNPSASSVLTGTNVNAADGETVTIANTIYTFKNVITSLANQIKIQGTADGTMNALIAAINNGAGAGTLYSSGTAINQDVRAGVLAAHAFTVSAVVGGTPGNAIVTTTTSANLSWTGATLSGGGSNAIASLTSSNVNVSNNDTVTINAKVYTFQTVLTNVDGHVLIGGSADDSLLNLWHAINLTGAPGKYAAATLIHPTVQAIDRDTTSHKLTLQAKASGADGNALTIAKAAVTLTLSGATFAGGGLDTNQITQIQVGATNLLTSYVQFNQTPTQTAIDVVTAINALAAVTGYIASATGSTVSISATSAGVTPNGTGLTVTAAGNVCIYNCNFTATPTVATGNISQIAVGATNLMTATITYQDAGAPNETMAQWLARVATNINLHTGTSGWLAFSTGIVLSLSKAVTTDADVMTQPSVTDANTVLVIGTDTGIQLALNTNTATFPPYQLGFKGLGATTQTVKCSPQPNISATGGTGPYTYKWKYAGGGAQRVICSDTTNNAPVWTLRVTYVRQPAIEPWTCEVKDSVGGDVTSETVNFYLE